MTGSTGRRLLVVGGTGMLHPLCQAIPPKELIVAARFASNRGNLAMLPEDVLRVPLDYESESSVASFVTQLAGWQDLDACVLWVHSPAHGFSRTVIKSLSDRQNPPRVIHLFGSGTRSDQLTDWAAQNQVPFTAVQLGKVETATGWRWMTQTEISAQTARALAEFYPALDIT